MIGNGIAWGTGSMPISGNCEYVGKRERDRERKRETERGKELWGFENRIGGRELKYVCVCERERE